MSEVYSLKRKNNKNPWRVIRDEEKKMIQKLLENHPLYNKYENTIQHQKVRTMLDGDMGSIEFFCEKYAPMGGILAEAEYMDIDNIKVIITIIYNKFGELWEIDFWKVDFSSLKKYPKPEDLKEIFFRDISL